MRPSEELTSLPGGGAHLTILMDVTTVAIATEVEVTKEVPLHYRDFCVRFVFSRWAALEILYPSRELEDSLFVSLSSTSVCDRRTVGPV